MIPKLFGKTETAFTSNGLGQLAEAISCTAEEERNGEYTLRMSYPVTGALYKQITYDSVILAKPSETQNAQPFRIVRVQEPISGICEYEGEHISYQTNDIPVFPFTATSIAGAVSGMITNSAAANPFTFSTSKTTLGNFTVKAPTEFRALMGGREGSLLDIYGGGEYRYDLWNIYLDDNRGRDNGVTIAYGKNLTDFNQEQNIASLVTGVAPFWMDNDGNLVTLPEKTIQIQTTYSYSRVKPLDLSMEFEEAPTVTQLRTAANNFIEITDLKNPKVNLTVSFVALSQTDQYKDIAALERVALCDIVTVQFPDLGVNVKAKVIRTLFDVLTERYIEIEIGDARTNFSQIVLEQQREIEKKPSTNYLEQAILDATNAITGATGGYVVLDPPEHPQRILVMDTPNQATTVRVWQWNLNGLGFSGTGVNGPYSLAMTTNPGAIVADFITAGTLNANIIKAGVLASNNGVTSFDLASGELDVNLSSGASIAISASGITLRNGSDNIASFYMSSDGRGVVIADYLAVGKNNSFNGSWYLNPDGTTTTLRATTINASDFFASTYSGRQIIIRMMPDSAGNLYPTMTLST